MRFLRPQAVQRSSPHRGAKIETVTANAQTNVAGNGTVSNVEARANDVKVDTAGTKVTVFTYRVIIRK